MAVIASNAFVHAQADIHSVSHLTGYANDRAFVIALASSAISGSSVSTVVIISSNEDDGVYAHGLSDFFYHRIWVIPKHTDLGNIVSDQVRQVELWNAHFVSKTLTGYTVDGDITVDGFASGVIAPLESEMYAVSITLAGAPILDADIVYSFSDAEVASIVATIIGRRVVPFTLRHNWADPVLEQISFKTDVIKPDSGKEQRIGLRAAPRRRFEMSYLTLTPQERTYLENVQYGWQGRAYAIPLWSDKTKLRTDAPINTTVFDVDTVSRDFEPGALLFITDGKTADTLEVQSVTSGSVTTVTGSRNAYVVGAKVAPARIGVMDSKFNLSRHTTHHESARLAWQINPDQTSTKRLATYTPELYRDVEVYNVSNDYSNEITIDQEFDEEIADNDLGIFNKFSNEPYPRRTYPFHNLLIRSELSQFLQWVYNRQGQLKPVWFVERTPAFYLQADATSDASNLIIKGYEFHSLAFPSEARRDIAVRTSAGWRYRRITGSNIDDFGVETITLDNPLGVAVTAAENPLMCYLKFVRLATDMVELSYQTTDAIQTAMSFKDLQTNQ